jgi:symplekin
MDKVCIFHIIHFTVSPFLSFKPDTMRHLPQIVSILNGQTEPKNLVRLLFSSIVTTPPQTFGSVTSNLPRVRQSELLTPAELMVLLHESEKEIGLKSAIEGSF